MRNIILPLALSDRDSIRRFVLGMQNLTLVFSGSADAVCGALLFCQHTVPLGVFPLLVQK